MPMQHHFKTVAMITLALLISVSPTIGAPQQFDVKFKSPNLTITHQSPNLGSCDGGTSEPCDVFTFSTKFSCGDCFTDFTGGGGVLFQISTDSACTSQVYFSFRQQATFIQSSTSTFVRAETFMDTDGSRDFLLESVQIKGRAGTISIAGNTNLASLTSGPLFVKFSFKGDKTLDPDGDDVLCVQVPATFQNLP